jgi:hypothetical protein
MKRDLALIVIAWAVLAMPVSAQSAPSGDRQARIDVEQQLQPIAAWRKRTEDTLRAAAGTPAADAALLAARLELQEIVARVTSPLDTPEFQRLIWPDGAAGQAYRRAAGARGSDPAPERVSADALVRFMKDRGVWPQRAEGDTYFHASDAALLDWFGPLVSAEIRTFLELWAHEQGVPVAEDASIQVPLDELERRILATERFLAEFPQSPVRDPVRVRYRHYLALYLGGTGNTPAFDERSGALRPDLLRRFETYAAAHDTPSARTVAQYLKLLAAGVYRRTLEVTRFLESARGDPRDWRLLRY